VALQERGVATALRFLPKSRSSSLSEDGPTDHPLVNLKERIANFVQSPEIAELSSRLGDLVAKARAGQIAGAKSPSKVTGDGRANFLYSAALHGVFMGLWSEFELVLEVPIMNLSGMSPQNTSIVCTPIQIGVKMQIALSLLNSNNNDEKGTELLKKVQDVASRNIYIHGFWDADETFEKFYLYHREAKNSYVVKRGEKNRKDLANHLIDFGNAWVDAQKHFNISHEDVTSYKKSIVDLEPVHASLASIRQQSKTSSRKAKKDKA